MPHETSTPQHCTIGLALDLRSTADHCRNSERNVVVVVSIVQVPTTSMSNTARFLVVKHAKTMAWIAATPDETISAPAAPSTNTVLFRQ